METLFLLIPLSLLAIAVAVWIFFRMSDSGQFDDMDGPAHSVLLDDDGPPRQAGAIDDAAPADASRRGPRGLDPDQ